MVPAVLGPAPQRVARRRDRLVGVDVARGFALAGMVCVHVYPARGPDGRESVADLVAGGRSAAAFAVVAGVGLALATGGIAPPVGLRRQLLSLGLVVRALFVGAVGLVLGVADAGVAVVLPSYALLFVLAVPVLGWGARRLATAALVIALAVPVLSFAARSHLPAPDRANPVPGDLLTRPAHLLLELLLTGYYPALAWGAYLLAGLAAGRAGLVSRRCALALLGGGAALAAAALASSALLLGPLGGRGALLSVTALPPGESIADRLADSQFGNVPTTSAWWLAAASPHASTTADLLATTGTALALLGACLLVTGHLPGRPGRVAAACLAPIAAAGSMPLTLYSAHVVLLASGALPARPLPSVLIQLAGGGMLALAWRRLVGRGPLEALLADLLHPLRAPQAPQAPGPPRPPGPLPPGGPLPPPGLPGRAVGGAG